MNCIVVRWPTSAMTSIQNSALQTRFVSTSDFQTRFDLTSDFQTRFVALTFVIDSQAL